MFDSKNNSFWHSDPSSSGPLGVEVNFKKYVVVKGLKFMSRPECCNKGRYDTLAVFVDGKLLERKTGDGITAGTLVEFTSGKGMWGKKVELKWESEGPA